VRTYVYSKKRLSGNATGVLEGKPLWFTGSGGLPWPERVCCHLGQTVLLHGCPSGKTEVPFRKRCAGYFLTTHHKFFLYTSTIDKWCIIRPNLALEK
jgi:hypothetical protein